MKLARFSKILVTAGLAVACMGGLAACGSASAGGSGAVAAKINDVTITEDEVTNMIEAIRAQYGVTDEATWAQFLIANSMTPEQVREQMIDSFIERELVKVGAKQEGITIDSAEIDTYVESMRANYATEDAWKEALKGAGFTEEEYRENIEVSLLQQKLNAQFTESVELTDDDRLEAARTYIPYYDGARRSSHILFAADDQATAQQVLDQINAGTLDFADAAKQYSLDGSAANGGDVGWDVTSNFVTEYQTALSSLEEGQVSGLVTSQYGIHIIKCTEVFKAPDEVTSLDQLPEAFRETIERMATSLKAQNAYQEFLEGVRESCDVVVNDMPSNVPYNVDLSKYQTASDSASAESASTDAASGESASSDAAASASSASDSASESASSDSASASSEQASSSAASSGAASSGSSSSGA